MKRIMLRVAYDGTEYCGWQRQPNGITVEGVLNHKLSALLKEEIEVVGASRTDAGVHARGNVCVFDTNSRIPGEKFAHALNPLLPGDITVQESSEVAADFHPRYCAINKTYEYWIYNATFPDPLLRRYTHFLYRPLDVAAMQQAAGYLIGEHDFKSFCSVNTQVKETVRKVNILEVLEEGVAPFGGGVAKISDRPRLITIRINGNGFLYNMVRIIAGTLIEVGYHRRGQESLVGTLAACDRQAAGATAPACGLTLVGIQYNGALKEGS
ncbi:MAG: tRNA pseudouridine(38-40) synthase TruA [Lachnospiraceae bacterium]|nr:tRNA pseudouridine(38-40) synthase TruA [Lachnospiraceae bacterium]